MVAEREKVCEIVAKYESRHDSLIPMLQDIQSEYNYLPEGALRVLAAYSKLRKSGALGDDTRLLVKTSKSLFRSISGVDGVELIADKIPMEEMVELYQECDVFVYPTFGEGLGLEPLEAIATAACTIVGNWSGTTEYIAPGVCLPLEPDTIQPFPLEPFASWGNMAHYSIEEIARQMLWCYQNRAEARTIGKRAAEHVRQNWTWDQAAERAAALLHTYVGGLK